MGVYHRSKGLRIWVWGLLESSFERSVSRGSIRDFVFRWTVVFWIGEKMISGECIHCDAPFLISFVRYGVMEKCTCESCGKVHWLMHSRFMPVSYTEEMIEINDETREVKIKAAFK